VQIAMKSLIYFILTFLVAASAEAQVSNFSGYSGSINLSTMSVNTKLDTGGGTIDGIGKQSWKISTRVGYGLIASRNSVVTVGANYTLGNTHNGTVEAAGQSLSLLKLSNQFSLYAEPAALIGDTTLAYGKISYEYAKVAISSNSGEQSDSMRGIGLGLGIRTMLNKKSFVQAEMTQTSYREVPYNDTSMRSHITAGTVGLGIKF